jgi:polyhydroxybutyrate depolymerase
MRRVFRFVGSWVVAATACGDSGAPAMMEAGTETSREGTTTGMDTGEETEPADGPFPGCGVDPGFEGMVVGTMEVAGVERRFVVVLPDDHDASEPLALVFGFHGRGSSAEQFRLYAGLEQAAAGRAVFVYPQGLPIASMGGQSGWDLATRGDDVTFVERLLDDLEANLCIDPDRVYAAGHSFGGYFSNTLGCALPGRLRAIGPVAGGGPLGSCSEGIAAIVIHGVDDEVVPTSVGESTRDHWLSANGCDDETDPAEPDACVAYRGCDPGLDVVWCLHDESPGGLGTHMWPGFAGAAIWAFFDALPA